MGIRIPSSNEKNMESYGENLSPFQPLQSYTVVSNCRQSHFFSSVYHSITIRKTICRGGVCPTSKSDHELRLNIARISSSSSHQNFKNAFAFDFPSLTIRRLVSISRSCLATLSLNSAW